MELLYDKYYKSDKSEDVEKSVETVRAGDTEKLFKSE